MTLCAVQGQVMTKEGALRIPKPELDDDGFGNGMNYTLKVSR